MSTKHGMRSLARGAVLALAAAMAFATFGCQRATDSESEDEQVDEIALPLAPGSGVAGGEDQPGGNGSTPSRGGEQMNDDDQGEPEPQPWIQGNTGNASQPGPHPVDPSTRSSVVSPTGHH